MAFDDDDFRRSIFAAEDVIKAVVRTDVRKALDPLNADDFLKIVAQVARALERDVRPYEVSAVASAIDAISGVDWASLTKEQMDAAIDAIRSVTNDIGKVVMPSVEDTFRIAGTRTMRTTRASTIRRFGFKIATSMSQRDLAAERWARALNTLYVRDSYGVRADDMASIARDIVAKGLEEGVGSDEIATRLAESMTHMGQTPSYWNVIATSFSNTARTFSQLGSYRDAGITGYQFEAVMDEVTTDQCRFYHGQTFSVGGSIALMESLTALEDPEAVKNANPWIRSGRDDQGNRVLYFNRDGERSVVAQVDRSGIGARDDRGSFSRAMTSEQLTTSGVPMPPLHGRCRSTIVPMV